MLKYALVHDNIVVNITEQKPDGKFYEPGLLWVPFEEEMDVQEGYQYCENNGTFKRPRLPLQQEKDRLLFRINAVTDKVYEHMISRYPRAEVNTFYRQELEVERWMRGDKRVPFLMELANTRKIPIEEMVRRVQMKAELMAPILAKPFAGRQAIEDQIDVAVNYEQLDEIEKFAEQWIQHLLAALKGGK